jgi:hypothetical protein
VAAMASTHGSRVLRELQDRRAALVLQSLKYEDEADLLRSAMPAEFPRVSHAAIILEGLLDEGVERVHVQFYETLTVRVALTQLTACSDPFQHLLGPGTHYLL